MPIDNSLLEKIYNKVETLDSRIDTIDKTLVRQEENLKEHMRRSQAAESGIETLKNEIILIHKDELQPIKDHILVVKKIFGALSALLVSSGLLIWILEKFFK